MSINKISNINMTTGTHGDKSEYDKWATLSQTKMADNKLNARAGFRNSVGMNQAEYKKQAENAKKQGFEAILREEIKKRA